MHTAPQILTLPLGAALALTLAAGGCREPAQAAEAHAAPSASAPAGRAPDQDRYRRPDLLVGALPIAAGATVADVGAGAGYLTHRLAARAGARGRVVATDVDGDALSRIGPAAAGEAPIETRRVAPDDPGLEPAAYNLILLSEVDHLLGDRASYLAKLARALAPGGRIAISNRRAHRAAALAAVQRAGLVVASEYTELPAHFLVEVKP
jgi:SAM-dependent methyltransferase